MGRETDSNQRKQKRVGVKENFFDKKTMRASKACIVLFH